MPTESLPIDALLCLLPGGIEASERRGNRQMLTEAKIPTKRHDVSDADLVALGFVLGAVVDGDSMFQSVTLPDGWSRGDGENMYGYWTYLLDEKGRRRFAMFYKAAFYDRDAFMHPERRYSVGADSTEETHDLDYDDRDWRGVVRDGGEVIYTGPVHKRAEGERWTIPHDKAQIDARTWLFELRGGPSDDWRQDYAAE